MYILSNNVGWTQKPSELDILVCIGSTTVTINFIIIYFALKETCMRFVYFYVSLSNITFFSFEITRCFICFRMKYVSRELILTADTWIYWKLSRTVDLLVEVSSSTQDNARLMYT